MVVSSALIARSSGNNPEDQGERPFLPHVYNDIVCCTFWHTSGRFCFVDLVVAHSSQEDGFRLLSSLETKAKIRLCRPIFSYLRGNGATDFYATSVMSYLRLYFIAVLIMCPLLCMAQDLRYQLSNGYVHFVSDAPLERIEAESESLKGVIDVATREFAFTIPVRTFQGFNSPLQQEHFHENYMETDRNPNGQFTGRIVEEIDLTAPGIYQVRAKGTLRIHGIATERIIPATIEVKEGEMTLSALFDVPLSDHDISIPRIVRQKIAEDIAVTVEATFTL